MKREISDKYGEELRALTMKEIKRFFDNKDEYCYLYYEEFMISLHRVNNDIYKIEQLKETLYGNVPIYVAKYPNDKFESAIRNFIKLVRSPKPILDDLIDSILN